MSEQIIATSSYSPGGQDLFMPEFKRLKARSPLPDLTGVIDLRNLDVTIGEKAVFPYPVRTCGLKPVTGLKPCEQWKVCHFSDYPGFIIIENPFSDGYQKYWVCQCLQTFPSDCDNVTNLTALGEDGRKLWQDFVDKKSSVFKKQDPLRKLRWTTLGYHYNWTSKEYTEESRAEFPPDVNCLSQYFAACLGFAPYWAQAGIVNYYHLDSTLAGHVDHSEVDHSAPIFSISFGQTAIFLLGGRTKSVKPMSVYLRSGDVCVMSGDCRLAYHAVPKILTPTLEEPEASCFRLQQGAEYKLRSSKYEVTESQPGLLSSATFTGEYADATISNEGESLYSGQCVGESLHSDQCARESLNSDDQCVLESLNSGQCVGKSLHSGHRHEASAVKSWEAQSAEQHNNIGLHVNESVDPSMVTFLKNYNSNIDRVNSCIKDLIATLEFRPFETYLKSSRINLNIRQVLAPGMSRLPSV